ncbi:MAG: GtrA family protein [Dehalococcoidia bacterium]|jgi:putative flippase GtrA
MPRIPTRPSELRERARALYANRVARFLAVGGTCAIVQLSILHTLVVSGVEPHLGNLAAFIVSMELNFVLSQFFTWRDRWSAGLRPSMILGRFLMFNVSASATSGVLNQGAFALFSLFISYLPAAAIGICVAATSNFLLNDRVVFRLWGAWEAALKTARLER